MLKPIRIVKIATIAIVMRRAKMTSWRAESVQTLIVKRRS
jgi:hypothetical protein